MILLLSKKVYYQNGELELSQWNETKFNMLTLL